MSEEIFDKTYDQLTIEEISFEILKQIKRVADVIQDQNDFYVAETVKRESQAEEKAKTSKDNENGDAADGVVEAGSGVGQDNSKVGEGI